MPPQTQQQGRQQQRTVGGSAPQGPLAWAWEDWEREVERDRGAYRQYVEDHRAAIEEFVALAILGQFARLGRVVKEALDTGLRPRQAGGGEEDRIFRELRDLERQRPDLAQQVSHLAALLRLGWGLVVPPLNQPVERSDP